jgi:fatty acid desaturase
VNRIAPILTILIFLAHGTFYAFILNGFHELSHNTVFPSRRLNSFFLHLSSFLSWNNCVFFSASHARHHRYTLHPPDDKEVVLPVNLTVGDFLLRSFINPLGLVQTVWATLRTALGQIRFEKIQTPFGAIDGKWFQTLFEPGSIENRRRLRWWACCILAGHMVIIAGCLSLGWWAVPVAISAAPFYGSWLLYLLNHAQHTGLMDNVTDFRLCARTILVNPFLRFLYWNMNYHLEHHMYAAVPFYHLPSLHEAVKHDTPEPKKGLLSAWRHIIVILNRQVADPDYRYNALDNV